MKAELANRPGARVRPRDRRRSRACRPVRLERPTLDDVITTAWAAVAAGAPLACPVCSQRMDPGPNGPTQATCRVCGTTLE